MPSFTVSLSMRNTFTMILPSMMMLSLSLRERMSITSSDGVEHRRRRVERQNVRRVQVLRFVVECADKTLHEVQRTAKQRLVLLRALAHAEEQFVIFLDQSRQQRLIGLRQQRNELREAGV